MRPEAELKVAAERAAASIYEIVLAVAEKAAVQAVKNAIDIQLGVKVDDVSLDDRVTVTEAARQLEVTRQRIGRLVDNEVIPADKSVPGRVYVSLSEARAALVR